MRATDRRSSVLWQSYKISREHYTPEAGAEDPPLVAADRRFGYISDLYVSPSGRGQGIGAALLNAAEAHFRALALATVRLNFLHNNDSAQRLYDRSG